MSGIFFLRTGMGPIHASLREGAFMPSMTEANCCHTSKTLTILQ